jgi:hypothetical protein
MFGETFHHPLGVFSRLGWQDLLGWASSDNLRLLKSVQEVEFKEILFN